MTHPRIPARTRWPLLAALSAAVPATASVADAQTKTAPVSKKTFVASLSAAKKQTEAAAQQATAEATKTRKALADAEQALLALQKAQQSKDARTDELKVKIKELEAQIGQLKEQIKKLDTILTKVQTLKPKFEEALSADGGDPCSSDTKGKKAKLTEGRQVVDGLVGTTTAELAAARVEEKKQTAPKVKLVHADYAKSLVAIGGSLSTLSAALKGLEDQAATMGCK